MIVWNDHTAPLEIIVCGCSSVVICIYLQPWIASPPATSVKSAPAVRRRPKTPTVVIALLEKVFPLLGNRVFVNIKSVFISVAVSIVVRAIPVRPCTTNSGAKNVTIPIWLAWCRWFVSTRRVVPRVKISMCVIIPILTLATTIPLLQNLRLRVRSIILGNVPHAPSFMCAQLNL